MRCGISQSVKTRLCGACSWVGQLKMGALLGILTSKHHVMASSQCPSFASWSHIDTDALWCLQLARAVESWEPRSETVALHAWLHPWLPYLGSRMEDLYPSIRFKLSTALQQWHPSDQSALALLSPWHTVSSLLLVLVCSCALILWNTVKDSWHGLQLLA